jgi:hypothetical protein
MPPPSSAGGRGAERGQASPEYVGLIVLVSVVVVALVAGAVSLGGTVTDGLQTLICKIARQGCEAAGAAAGQAGSPDGGSGGGDGGPLGWLAGQAGDLLGGAWDTVTGLAGFTWDLLPLHSGWTDAWKRLGEGLADGIRNPVELLKGLVGWDVLQERGFSYWLGGVLVTAGIGFGVGRLVRMLRAGSVARGAAAGGAAPAGAGAAAGAARGGAALTRHGDLLIRRWTPIDPPGPLSSNPAWLNSFRSATYNEVQLAQPTTLYRVYSDPARQLGPFWSRSAPGGPTQALLDDAILPSWGNRATSVVEIKAPAGTIVYEGPTGPQPLVGQGAPSAMVGGGEQVLIPRVDPGWVVRSWDFDPPP